MSPTAASIHVDRDALRVAASDAAAPWTIAFIVLWFSGWLLTVLISVLEFSRHPSADNALTAAWIALWLGAGIPVAIALLWVAAGKREAFIVQGPHLIVERSVGGFRWSSRVDAYSANNLRVAPPLGRFRDWMLIKNFWTGGAGRVKFDCGRRTYAFGAALSDADAASLVATIGGMFSHLVASYSPELSRRHRRPELTWGLAYLSMTMLVPTVALPVRLAITDRTICFCDDSVLPDSPIDVSQARRSGRVYLVPMDGISPERAKGVADYFAHEFGTPIRVAQPLAAPDHVYDSTRRQMDSVALLTLLERQYPSERDVVIAMTTTDMYIPGVSWRYAFSYRHAGRLAIVSTARMDRGCLGLFEAGESRQLSRLRKMVGKNIGVLYYRLPLSRDPKSLLYANIGGPQELDGMSERF